MWVLDGGSYIPWETVSAGFDPLVDVLHKEPAQPVLGLELFSESVVIIMLMQKYTIHLALLDLYLDDRFISTLVPINGPRLDVRDSPIDILSGC